VGGAWEWSGTQPNKFGRLQKASFLPPTGPIQGPGQQPRCSGHQQHVCTEGRKKTCFGHQRFCGRSVCRTQFPTMNPVHGENNLRVAPTCIICSRGDSVPQRQPPAPLAVGDSGLVMQSLLLGCSFNAAFIKSPLRACLHKVPAKSPWCRVQQGIHIRL
jgi:hypothetical protein